MTESGAGEMSARMGAGRVQPRQGQGGPFQEVDDVTHLLDDGGEGHRSLSAALVLHDLQGLKNREIADALDISLSTVKIRLNRARRKLRESLDTGCYVGLDERNVFVCEPKAESERGSHELC